jgi:hypothetical protein
VYGVDSVVVYAEQIRKPSVAYKNAVRRETLFRDFAQYHCTSVVVFLELFPVSVLLEEKRVLLVKECINSLVFYFYLVT